MGLTANRPVPGPGTVNALFRLGEDLGVRLPLRRTDPISMRIEIEREVAAARVLLGKTPFRTPEPIAIGDPGAGYPLPWSIQTWLPGRTAGHEDPGGSVPFARDLATFIRGVRAISTGGHSFSGSGRGGDLSTHDGWMDTCFQESAGLLDVAMLRRMWKHYRALPPSSSADVTSHGDLTPATCSSREVDWSEYLTWAEWDLRTRPSNWSAPGTSLTMAPDKSFVPRLAATSCSGNGARPGPSSSPWDWSGTTATATRA